MMNPEELATGIADAMREAGDPTRAAREQQYLKSTRSFVGCDVPTCRQITRHALKEHPPLSHGELWRTVDLLWIGPFFETRRAAVEILKFKTGLLERSDLPRLRTLIADGETWAIVDELAVHVVGEMTTADPDIAEGALKEWSKDESFWVRRSVLLAHLLTLRGSPSHYGTAPGEHFNRLWLSFTSYAEQMLPERELFIRKAIGWVLRDASKAHPDLVRAWVEPRLSSMSGVTRREATKYL